jgi:hypothetical protein
VDYPEFIARLANTALYAPDDADFLVAAVQALEAAELRILRDLDPMVARVTGAALPYTAGSRAIALPADCVIPRRVWVQDGGRWWPLNRRQSDWMLIYAPDEAVLGRPRYWSLDTDAVGQMAPTPPAGLSFRVDYTRRPTPMSASNPSTWIGTNLPDLLFAAAMVWIAGFQRNFGEAGGGDGASWGAAYMTALASAVVEERRRKADGPWDNSRVPPVSSGAPPG